MTELEYYQLHIENTRAYKEMLERRDDLASPEWKREKAEL